MKARLGFLVAGLLLVGAVVQVLVAWSCAWMVDYRQATEQIILTKSFDEYGGYLSVAQRTAPGITQTVKRVMVPTSYGVAGSSYILEFPETYDKDELIRLKPGQSLRRDYAATLHRWRKGKAPSGMIALWPWETSAGWPMRSMQCWHENLVGVPSSTSTATAGPVRVLKGIELQSGVLPSEMHVLPGGRLSNLHRMRRSRRSQGKPEGVIAQR